MHYYFIYLNINRIMNNYNEVIKDGVKEAPKEYNMKE